MLGVGFLAILTLAVLMWAAMALRAKIRRQAPPWKGREPSETPPMIQAYWGGGVKLPEISQEQRKRNVRVMAVTVITLLVVAGASAWITWSLTANGGEAVFAGILAYVGVFLVALPIAAVFDTRRERPRNRCRSRAPSRKPPPP